MKPTRDDYDSLGVCEWTDMVVVDRQYQEKYETLKGDDERSEHLYMTYSRIVEYLYTVENGGLVNDVDNTQLHDTHEGDKTEVEADDKIIHQHITKEFTCEVCKKAFSTKQKLQQHVLKRFKCEPENSAREKLVCVCGSKFTKFPNLYRHKAKCSKCLKSKRTMKALEDPDFFLNSYEDEKATYNRDTFMNCIKELNTSTNRFEIEYFNKTKTWYGYKEVMKGMIKRTFFLSPENYTFYIPNMSNNVVYVHRNGKKETITKEELAEHIIAFCVNEFEDLVHASKSSTENTEQFLQHHPVHYINAKVMYEEDNILVQSLKCQFIQHIMIGFKEYKDDIKRIWNMKGLL